jgi:hypothetical protein
MPAHTATNRGERIRGPGVAVSFLVPPLRDEGDVASGLRVNGAGLHAWEVRLEPLQVDEFGSASQEDCLESLSRYFLTVNSTVVLAEATSTACVVGLPSSLQVFNVYFPAGMFLISKLPSLSVTAK